MPKKGFTLIELLVVISIIAILTALGAVSFTNSRRAARDTRRLGDVKNIVTALEQYYADNGSYPVSSPATCLFSGGGDWCCSQNTGGTSNWIPGLSSYISGGVQNQFGGLQGHCFNSNREAFSGGYVLHYTLERRNSNASGSQIDGGETNARYQIRGTGN